MTHHLNLIKEMGWGSFLQKKLPGFSRPLIIRDGQAICLIDRGSLVGGLQVKKDSSLHMYVLLRAKRQ